MPATEGGAQWSAIRTPDQRLRVFVSSTLEELTAERGAARAAIEQLRLAPVMFESGARAHPPQAVYRAYPEQSDIFVGIYWQRYGWVGPGMAVSGLEDELRLAAGMPRLLYVKVPAPGMEPGLERMLDGIRARAPQLTRGSPTRGSCGSSSLATWLPCSRSGSAAQTATAGGPRLRRRSRQWSAGTPTWRR
jgi:hypothetical protein